jgi:tetratricopeptide (TPR) repeat protein
MVDRPKILDDPITDVDLYQAFRLMKKKDFVSALAILNKGLKKEAVQADPILQGLFLSALGVLYKLQNDFKAAYKFYQQAEKLMPDEGSLKIITALLLIEEFAQYDTALKKLDKVMLSDGGDPAMVHHVRAARGMALYLMGKKAEARALLDEQLADDFTKLRSGANLDFKLIELFLRKNFEIVLCRLYLEKALAFVTSTKESSFIALIRHLLTQLPVVMGAP